MFLSSKRIRVTSFNRLPPAHPDKTYAYLRKCVNDMLELRRTDKLRADQIRALGSKTVPVLPVATGPTKAEKKAAAKEAALAAAPATNSGATTPRGDKNKACFRYQVGECKNGAECSWGHFKDPEALKVAQTPRSPRGRSPKGKGKGTKGRADSPPRTDADRAKIKCRLEKLGTCRDGSKCKFLHVLAAAVVLLNPVGGTVAVAAASFPRVQFCDAEVFEFPMFGDPPNVLPDAYGLAKRRHEGYSHGTRYGPELGPELTRQARCFAEAWAKGLGLQNRPIPEEAPIPKRFPRVAAPAMPKTGKGEPGRARIADTGAGIHLSGVREGQTVFQGDTVPLITAKGKTSASTYTEVFLTWLNETCKTLILPNCPDVLFVGRLVEEHKIRFL
jgi:hypothetical protein